MTTNKAAKRAIRSRMSKTGERYTAARRHVAKDAARTPKLPPRVADPGWSDETVRKGSGKTWDEWLGILDAWGAKDRTHTEIARHVARDHGVPGWWAQTVAVGYERARGMRKPNTNVGGERYVTVSKTVNVPVEELFAAMAEPPRRNRWLGRDLPTEAEIIDWSQRFAALHTQHWPQWEGQIAIQQLHDFNMAG